MTKITKKEVDILSVLRKDSRLNLTSMSKETGIPISTCFEKIKSLRGSVIKRFTCLLDFEEIGCSASAIILLRTDKDQRKKLTEFLKFHSNVNSLYKVNNGYDLIADCIFANIKEISEFTELLEEKFDIEKELFYVTDAIKKEEFGIKGLI